jgi:hypothetical protein
MVPSADGFHHPADEGGWPHSSGRLTASAASFGSGGESLTIRSESNPQRH